MAGTRVIWQRAAKEIFDLPEGQNDAIRVPIRQVRVERSVLAGDLGCASKRDAQKVFRHWRVGCRQTWRAQLPSPNPFPHEGSARLRDDDPCIHFGEINADAAFTGTRTHVDGGSVFRLAEASLQFRLRLMTDWTLVGRRRTVVGDPHGEPSWHLFEPTLERRDFVPATLMRLAAGAGREAQERNSIIHARTALAQFPRAQTRGLRRLVQPRPTGCPLRTPVDKQGRGRWHCRSCS